MNLYNIDILNFLCEIYLGLSLIFVFYFGLVYEKEGVCPELSFQAKLVLFWVFLLLIGSYDTCDSYFMLNSNVLDGWSILLKGCFIFFLFFYFFFLKNVSFEYISLVLIFNLATFFLLSSHNFLTFYLSLELSSFILYLLVASRTSNLLSTEAGLKYFVLGSFSSILLLLGIVFCYGLVGSIDFSEIFLFGWELDWAEGHNFLMVSFFFILVGLLFKLGVAPFHFWLPDVYEGSDYLVLLFLVVFSKIGIFGSLVRLVYDVFSFKFEVVSFFLFILGTLSLLVGTLGALWQKNLKRLIAYSGISHMGFLLFGLSSGTGMGLIASLFYFIFYLILNMGWILSLMYLNVERLEELKGSSGGLLGFYLIVTMFSIAGVPPLGGFFIKLYLFFSLIQIEFWVAVLFLIFGSLISAYYYLRLIELSFFSTTAGVGRKKGLEFSVGEGYVFVFLMMLNVFFIFFQNILFYLILTQ